LANLNLDAFTLLICLSVLAFLLAAVSLTFEDTKTTDHFGLTEWSNAMCAAAGSFLLFFLHGYVPWFLTFLVGNTLFLAVAPFGLLAHAKLFRAKSPRRFIAMSSAVGLSGVLAVYFFDVSRKYSIFTVSAAAFVQFGLIAFMIFRNSVKKLTAVAGVSCAMVALMAAAFAMRAVLSLSGSASFVLPLANTAPQVGTFVVGIVYLIAASIGFFSMVNGRRQREALAAMRIDGLSGQFTRAGFFDLAEAIDEPNRPEPYAVVMLGIDQLSSLDDNFGRQGGERILDDVGRRIAGLVRPGDFAGRYGAEELFVLMRNCSETEAAQFAVRLVSEAEQQPVRLSDGREAACTLSAGYAGRTASSRVTCGNETVHDVLERAALALGRAQNNGRAQVQAATFPYSSRAAIASAFGGPRFRQNSGPQAFLAHELHHPVAATLLP
jgi:diguanylate cyclase (GGDEF)-like protein